MSSPAAVTVPQLLEAIQADGRFVEQVCTFTHASLPHPHIVKYWGKTLGPPGPKSSSSPAANRVGVPTSERESSKQDGDTAAQNAAQVKLLLDVDTIPGTLWPAARDFVEWLLVEERRMLTGKRVLELGSGLGLVGMAIAQVAASVVLTDMSVVALALAELGIRSNRLSETCRVVPLRWGEPSQLLSERFDVVIGSDIFYFNSSLKAGLITASAALPLEGSFYCASAVRSDRMETDLDTVPQQYGFEAVPVAPLDGLPPATRIFHWIKRRELGQEQPPP